MRYAGPCPPPLFNTIRYASCLLNYPRSSDIKSAVLCTLQLPWARLCAGRHATCDRLFVLAVRCVYRSSRRILKMRMFSTENCNSISFLASTYCSTLPPPNSPTYSYLDLPECVLCYAFPTFPNPMPPFFCPDISNCPPCLPISPSPSPSPSLTSGLDTTTVARNAGIRHSCVFAHRSRHSYIREGRLGNEDTIVIVGHHCMFVQLIGRLQALSEIEADNLHM